MSCSAKIQIASSGSCQDVLDQEGGGTPTGVQDIAALAQRLLCITDGNERQHLVGQVLEHSVSLQGATAISLDDPDQITPEVRNLLCGVGSVAERVLLLPAATGSVRYFIGQPISKQQRHTNVFDGIELVVGQAQDAFTATPAVAKVDTLRPDQFDRNALAPALGRLNIVPRCLEHNSGVYISERFPASGLDYVRGNLARGINIDFATFRTIFHGLAQTVAHLHAQGLIHHDLKLENVVFQLGEDRQIQDIRLLDLESIRFVSEQRTAIAVLALLMEMKRALKVSNTQDVSRLKEVCQEYAHKLNNLYEDLVFEPRECSHEDEAELYAIEWSIYKNHEQSLWAFIQVLDVLQTQEDRNLIITELNTAFYAILDDLNSALTLIGTGGYASPDLLHAMTSIQQLRAGQRVDIDFDLDLHSQDVWSIGVIMLVICSPRLHNQMLAAKQPEDCFEHISKALSTVSDRVQGHSDPLVPVLIACLNGALRTNPQERWTLQELLEELQA